MEVGQPSTRSAHSERGGLWSLRDLFRERREKEREKEGRDRVRGGGR